MEQFEKIKKYLNLIKGIENIPPGQKRRMELALRVVSVIKNATDDPNGPDAQIIKNFLNSIMSTLFRLQEEIYDRSKMELDKLVTYSKKDSLYINQSNQKYLQSIENHILIIDFSAPFPLTQIIEQPDKYRNEYNDENDNNYKYIQWVIWNFLKTINIKYKSIKISDLDWLNTILLFKLYMVNELFPIVLDLNNRFKKFRSENHYTYIIQLIDTYQKSLNSDKQLQPLNTVIIKDQSIKICKKTSDRYAQQMIELLNTQMKYIKEDQDWEQSIKEFQMPFKRLYIYGIVQSLIDNGCLPDNLKESFFLLLMNNGSINFGPINWPYSDWKLYFILTRFMDEGLLRLQGNINILNYILYHFQYKGKSFDRIKLQTTTKRALNNTQQGSTYAEFSTKLNGVFNN